MGAEEGGGDTAVAAAATAGRTDGYKLRIYVGGLGGSVSADDLKKTFSSPQLGTVESVEVVRTKGRSFAYLDFVPLSDKGLAKLFSMYNGCMWKGGRLRLEKAKEHHLVRLSREWAEDAQLSNDDSHNHDVDAAAGSINSLEKPAKVSNLDNMQIRIFFPKLGKVKPLPFKGTGKRKYSFQRVEVPSLPVHFCDCEEHLGLYDMAKEEPSWNQEKESVGIDEEELNIMNSVMNKLFKRENCSEADNAKVEMHKSTNLIDDLQINENQVYEMADEDNLIINIVTSSNSKTTTSDIWGQKRITRNQDSQDSITRSQQKMLASHGKKIVPNKRKAPIDDRGDTNAIQPGTTKRKGNSHQSSDDLDTVLRSQATEPGAATLQSDSNSVRSKKSPWRHLLSKSDNATFHISDVTQSTGPGADLQSKPENHIMQSSLNQETRTMSELQEIKKSAEAVSATTNAVADKTSKSTSWLQKSSWMQLVGGPSHSSFSMSQILPGLDPEKKDPPQPKGTDYSILLSNEQGDTLRTDRSDPIPQVKENEDGHCSSIPNFVLANSKPHNNGAEGDQSNAVKMLQASSASKEAFSKPLSKKQPSRPMQTSKEGSGMGQGSAFVRSAASMKEWTKAKAALSGSLKNKRNGK